MLKSHPDKLLQDHLIGTKNWGEHFLRLSPCQIIQKNSTDEMLQSFLMLHDIGKATNYFQEYIEGGNVDGSLKSHSHLSALVFLKYQMLQGNIEKHEKTVKFMYISIRKHHDNLTTLKDNIFYTEEEKELLKKQWESIDKKELKHLFRAIKLEEEITDFTFEQLMDGVCQIQQKWRREDRKRQSIIRESEILDCSIQDYLLLQNLYSLLIDADKSEVALKNTNFVKNMPYNMEIANYLQSKEQRETPLNALRNEAFREVEESLEKIENNAIFSLTLPTGMGKTLNVLNFASKLKNNLEQKNGIAYKIIYALPFMSIIDQTAEEIEKILLSQNGKVDSNILLKHHHLAEIEWKTGEDTLKDTSLSKMLIEGWNSQIIVTTFIQLLETLIGYRNASQRKYHKLNNAILIFDEIQAVPIKYSLLLRKLFLEYTQNTNSKVILMTATQPNIMKKEEIMELCQAKKYYQPLRRTKLVNIFQEQTIEEWIEALNYEHGKTYLFIQNTIAASNKVYDKLKEKYKTLKIGLLNTNLPPFIRRKIIQEIKNKKYDMVVSTQLVEAGVDIDFDKVYRDFAPLPQILQSAGRANREGLKTGEVFITRLVKENKKRYAFYIYDKVDLSLTEKILGTTEEIWENEFMEKIQLYYEQMANEFIKSQDESIKIIKGISLCNCYEKDENERDIYSASDFHLIENQGLTIRVFIEFEEAKEIWQEYLLLCEMETENPWEKAARLQNIQRKMAEFVINVRIDKDTLEQNFPPCINGYYYVSEQMRSFYYDEEKGFGSTNIIFM